MFKILSKLGSGEWKATRAAAFALAKAEEDGRITIIKDNEEEEDHDD